MKKLLLIVVACLCVMVSLCACSGEAKENTADISSETETSVSVGALQKGEYLYCSLNSENMEAIQTKLPEEIHIRIDRSGAGGTAEVTDEETIEKIVAAFAQVTIGEETNEVVTDNYNGIWFTFADGTTTGISLNLKSLEINEGSEYRYYELENFEGLWDIMNDFIED